MAGLPAKGNMYINASHGSKIPSFALIFTRTMYHATVNGKKTYDVEWDGKSPQGIINGENLLIDMISEDVNKYHILLRNKSYSVELIDTDRETKTASIKVNGHVYQIAFKDRFDDLLKSLGMEGSATAKVREIKAPMPGLVLDILVAEGSEVEKDSPLLILEAMKMENILKSPVSGTIKRVNAVKGNAVEKNTVLLEFV
jgi:biotin carboxyl carrier protein